MPRTSSSRDKRNADPQKTHQRSSDSSWFEAVEIIDENDSEYLVRWAGKDLSTGKEWAPSWVT